jgi:elongation factor P
MIDVNQLRKGTTFTLDGEIYKVFEYRHHKPGRGNATIRVTVRNMRSGYTTEMTFSSGDRVQDIRVESRPVEFLFSDDQFLTFMDLESFEQPQLRREIFGDDLKYLKENLQLTLNSFDGEIIDYELPNTIDYEVIDSEMAVAGDTATGATKKVKTSTGLEVTVPLFVKVGDTIRVRTEDCVYMTRVN